MKTRLLPSLKEKKRYIAFEIVSEKAIPKEEIINSVNEICREFLGLLDYAKAGVQIIPELVKGKKGVVRVNSKYVDHVKASLMLIKKINGSRVIFKNTKTSGVLNKVKLKEAK